MNVAAAQYPNLKNTPSRYANPFATCWTRPGAMPFRFSNGDSAARLVAKLEKHDWRGAIVGPHGSGKSTLVEVLLPALRNAGRVVYMVKLRDGQRWLPRKFLSRCRHAVPRSGEIELPLQSPSPGLSHPGRSVLQSELLIIDGYEQLGWLERWRLARFCQRHRTGLLVTSHSMASIPLLIELAPNARLVQQLVDDLTAEVSTPITRKDVAASHACHGSNVREILFDLYDRHEHLRRERRLVKLRRA